MSTETGNDLTTMQIVEELEELVGTARRLPLSASVIVNEDETLELVDRLRVSLPEELVQARHTLDDRERIVGMAREEADQLLARADQEAQRLVTEAAEQAAGMVAESEILRQARAHGAQLITEAEEHAASIRAEADTYARDVMTQLEEQLMRAVATVRKGIETLPAPAGSRRRRREGRAG